MILGLCQLGGSKGATVNTEEPIICCVFNFRYLHHLNNTFYLLCDSTLHQGRAETFGGAGAQNIKGAHETRL